jgi:hypothetical protein
MILFENHQRSINAVATILERKLEELENCLLRTGLSARGVRITHREDLPKEQIGKIQHAIDHLYELLNAFCSRYNVPKEMLSLQKEVRVKASFLWEDLSGATSKSFAGYGSMEAEINKVYNDYITQMIEEVNIIIEYSSEN